LNVQQLTNEQAVERFYHEVSTPVQVLQSVFVKILAWLQGVCYSLKRFGGRWFSGYQAFDGDKFICLDSYSSQDCLVYSFGIR
jgi:hypothetical protein